MNDDIKLHTVDSNNIFIFGEINDECASIVMPQLVSMIDLEKKKSDDTKLGIRIFINSFGGNVDIALNFLGLIEFAKKNNIIIETIVCGNAYSAASLIACSGTIGYRSISEYAVYMIHLGYAYLSQVSHPVEADRELSHAKHNFEMIKNVYKKYANIKGLDKMLDNDYYRIYGLDIIKNGLADKIYYE